MLRELHITNLAVIEDAAVEFQPGLNVVTGQTGAGKSLILGAFELLLGLRTVGNLLRGGAAEGRVTGVFDLPDPAQITAIQAVTDLDDADLAPGDTGTGSFGFDHISPVHRSRSECSRACRMQYFSTLQAVAA